MTLDLLIFLIFGALVGTIAWWLGRSGRVEDGLKALRAELVRRAVLPPSEDDPVALRAELDGFRGVAQYWREEAERLGGECRGLREALRAAHDELAVVKASAEARADLAAAPSSEQADAEAGP